MRATFFLLLSYLILGLFLLSILSGALLWLALFIYLCLIVITIGYSDTVLLYLLGARELRPSDEQVFFEATSQEAYKLAVLMPRLYFYNGSLERAYIFQTGSALSLVLNKRLLEKCSPDELHAICFELLLQVKKKMAKKRTRSMFLLGSISWIVHAMGSFIIKLVPNKEFHKVIDWVSNFLLHPFLNFMFNLIMGKGYYKKLGNQLAQFPKEKELLDRVGLKLRRPESYYSLPSRKLLELASIYKSRHYQNIISLEFLPHEWDFFFNTEELKRAE
jgi:hypothetical protein